MHLSAGPKVHKKAHTGGIVWAGLGWLKAYFPEHLGSWWVPPPSTA
jgi:hypothetical protein